MNNTIVNLNQDLNGIEIVFTSKPNADTRDALKKAGFRWHNVRKLWYAKNTPERFELAKNLSEQGTAETEPLTIPESKFVDGGGLYDGWEGGNNRKWHTNQELKNFLTSDFRKAGISASIRFRNGGYLTSLTVTIRITRNEIAPFEDFANVYKIPYSGWLYYTDSEGKLKDIFADHFWAMEGDERQEMEKNIVKTAYTLAVKHLQEDNTSGYRDEDALTEKGKKIFDTVKQIVNSYNRDCTNSMIDYFDRSIYDHYAFKII